MLTECVKDNYYVRFNSQSYHCSREMQFISRLYIKFLDDLNFDSHWSVKYRSRPPGYVCLKSVSRTITIYEALYSQLSLLQKNALVSRLDVKFLESTSILTNSLEREI